MTVPFRDRTEAGRLLAGQLASYAGRADVIVLALPRGGVPVAVEVAQALGAPLDVFLVRKLGVPGHEELAMGAIASGGVRVLNDDVVDSSRIPPAVIDAVAARRRASWSAGSGLPRRPTAARRARPHRHPGGRRPGHGLDDAGGGEALRRLGPARIVVAADRGAPQACAAVAGVADECVCARRRPLCSTASAAGTRSSPRRPMRRFATSWSAPPRVSPIRRLRPDDIRAAG